MILNGRNIALLSDPAEIDAENRGLASNRAIYSDSFKRFEEMANTPAEKAALDKIAATRAAVVDVVTKMPPLVKAGQMKALIADSVDKVETGSKLVDQAGSTMHEIVGSIRQVAELMGGITVASQEQTRGIEQVNIALIEMDGVTQQNAALVEEAAAAAQAMQQQAAQLAQLVSVFQLGNEPKKLGYAVSKQRQVAAARAPARKAVAGADSWEEF